MGVTSLKVILCPNDVTLLPMSSGAYVYGVGFTVMHISLIGTLYVMFRSFKKFKSGKQLSLADRFPLYIAVTDLLLYVDVFATQYHPAVYGTNWEGLPCVALAILCSFAVFCNMSLIASVSIHIYYCVVYHRNLNFGKSDWKLLVAVVSGSLLLCIPGVFTAGPSKYWCYASSDSNGSIMVFLSLAIDLALYIVVLFTFFQIRRHINIHGSENSMFDTSTQSGKMTLTAVELRNEAKTTLKQRLLALEELVTTKCLTYIFNYFVQWILVVPAVVFPSFGYDEDWIYVLCNFALNIGGTLNAISYIRNEGFGAK